jgi:hypothetical protein
MTGLSRKRKRGFGILPSRSVLLVCRPEDKEWSKRVSANGRKYRITITVLVLASLSQLQLDADYDVVVLAAPHGNPKDCGFWWSRERPKSLGLIYGTHHKVRVKTRALLQHLESRASVLVLCTCNQGLYLNAYRELLGSESRLVLCGWDYEILCNYPQCNTWISRGCRLSALKVGSHLGRHVIINKK